jgi:Glyoxalase/Bleomycin resistance protein/Dioxygenase superfamily
VTVRPPDDDVITLSLILAETDQDRALVGKQGGSHPFFGIVTDDCLGEYQRMKSAGIRFHGEPRVEPYGIGVTLEDLYGNQIYLNQEPKSP